MLEFRLVQHFNRNYNTMQKHVGAERDCGFLQCLQSLQAVWRSLIATVKTTRNDCFPISEY
jgi:hypothetical protein